MRSHGAVPLVGSSVAATGILLLGREPNANHLAGPARVFLLLGGVALARSSVFFHVAQGPLAQLLRWTWLSPLQRRRAAAFFPC